MPTISDINLETLDLCDATAVSYPAATLLRRINEAYEKVVGWILEADGTWQWDDTNFASHPIGTYDLSNTVNKYSFNDKFLEIEEVQVLSNNGVWSILKPIDQGDILGTRPLTEIYKENGIPEYYDKLSDDTIALYPAPDDGVSVTLANGLKIRFRRTADLFTSDQVTAGTKVPGFISTAHYILSYMAAIPYCMKYKKDRVALYDKTVNEYKDLILKHYSRREQDKPKILTMAPISHR